MSASAAIALARAAAPFTVILLWPMPPADCCMCGKPCEGPKAWAVPYYCGPVPMGCSDGGYREACEPCYQKWEAWDDSLRFTGS
jgi:hypothetical protein